MSKQSFEHGTATAEEILAEASFLLGTLGKTALSKSEARLAPAVTINVDELSLLDPALSELDYNLLKDALVVKPPQSGRGRLFGLLADRIAKVKAQELSVSDPFYRFTRGMSGQSFNDLAHIGLRSTSYEGTISVAGQNHVFFIDQQIIQASVKQPLIGGGQVTEAVFTLPMGGEQPDVALSHGPEARYPIIDPTLPALENMRRLVMEAGTMVHVVPRAL